MLRPAPMQATRQQSQPNQISTDTTLRFEALSVKATVPSSNPLEHRQIRNIDPNRVHYENVGLKDILMYQGEVRLHLEICDPGVNGRLEDIPELGIFASAYEKMEPLPELAGALQSQLGLKLEQKRAPAVVFVVDHLERTPTAN